MSEVDRILGVYEQRAHDVPSDRYALTKPVNLFVRQTRERALLSMLDDENLLPLGDRRIIDVGCGTGQWLIDFETWGARRDHLAGIDLIPWRAQTAEARLASLRDRSGRLISAGADIRHGDASSLPWRDGTFDIVCQSMVFSSILDATMRRAVAREMARILASDGLIVWYDFFVDNPRNPNVRGMRKNEVRDLFPEFDMRVRRITLLPPLARGIVGRSWLLGDLLERVRLLNTHFLLGLRRRPSADRAGRGDAVATVADG
jgi:SAM-dependent methyltransferase